MNISRVHFRGFGRWVDRTFQFQEGINLVEAPNESGKSTLIQGLTSLLYGMKKEGVSRRQKENGYDQYLPWQSREYGGEIDWSLNGRKYRIIRSLWWEEDREQLVDLKTGRDLTEEFLMDRRKDRCFVERLTGFSRSLFQRVAYLSSQSLAEDREVVERIRHLITRGEEADLTPILNRLEIQLQEIGKTAQARSKPYGAAVARHRELEREVIQVRSASSELREDQIRLSRLKEELADRARRSRQARERADRLRRQAEAADRWAVLQEKRDHLRYKRDSLGALKRKAAEWKQEREKILPPCLLDPEEVAELRRIIDSQIAPRERLRELEEAIAERTEEIERLRKEKGTLLDLDESLLQRQLHLLEEARRLEASLPSLNVQETLDEKVAAMQLERDYQRLIRLQEQEETCRRKKKDLEDHLSAVKRLLEEKEREQFLREALAATIPPSRPGKKWLWGAVAGLLLALVLFQHKPFAGFLALAGTGYCFYRFHLQRKLARQVRTEGRNRRDRLKKEWERVQRERAEQGDSHPDATMETLLRQSGEMREELKEVYDDLARIIQEQESILDRWQVDSVTGLLRMAEQQRMKVQERAVARKTEEGNRARIAEIRAEVDRWAEPFRERLGAFDTEGWLRKIAEIGRQAREARERIQRLELERDSLQDERSRLESMWNRRQEELVQWARRLGTEDVDQWIEWMEQSERVHRLDRQIRDLSREMEELEQLRQTENWDAEWNRLEREMADLSRVLPSDGEFRGDMAQQIRTRLQEAEEEREREETAFREKEAEVLRLEAEIRTRTEQLPSLAELETMLMEAEHRVRELELERSALETAREVLQEAAREVREDVAPRLRPYASEWIAKVTHGRYDHLLIDPTDGLEMSVFVPETGERQPVERLSRGTVDQMYFALRLALVRFFSDHGSCRLPIILDDSLVHFDETRLREALRILGELSREHQIFLCTCQNREGNVLEEEGIPYTRQVL